MDKAKTGAKAKAGRPLSPHLTIYTLQINMVMSILHRITGATLYAGTVLFAWWIVAAAAGKDEFDFASAVLGSLPGKAVLFGYTWALAHHMLGGIRHLIWDTGAGFDLETVDLLSWATLVGSLALTALLWLGAGALLPFG